MMAKISLGSILGGGVAALLMGFLTDSILLDIAHRTGVIEGASSLASLPAVMAMLLSVSYFLGASLTKELLFAMVASLILFASGIMAVRARLPPAPVGIASGLVSFVILRKLFTRNKPDLHDTEKTRNALSNRTIVAYQRVNVDDLERISDALYSIRNTALFVKPSLLKTRIFAVLSIDDVDRGILDRSLETLPVNYAILETEDRGEHSAYVILTSEGMFTKSNLEKEVAKVLSSANILTLQGAEIVPSDEASNPITAWEIGK